MSFYAISALINATSSLLIGTFVLLKDRRNPINITFAIFSLFVFWWSTGYFFWQYAGTSGTALLAIRFFMAGSIFISTAFLHFSLVFTGGMPKYRQLVFLSYVLFLFFLIFDLTPWFVSGVTEKMSFKFWPVPGPLFHPFFILWTAQVVFVLKMLYATYKKSFGNRQKQIMYILIGTALGFMGGSTNHFLWYSIPIPPIGNILVTSYVVAVAIAVLRYHLFSIKLLIVDFAIILLNLFLFLNVFTSNSSTGRALDILMFVLVSIFSVVLLRGIYKDILYKERIGILVKEKATSNERLRKLEEQKTEFISIASHQLRTPLTVIKGYASMILEGMFGDINDSARNAMQNLYVSSERVADLVEEMLTVSRIEQGRMMLNFETIDLSELLQSTIKDMDDEIKNAKINLTFVAIGNRGYYASVDTRNFKHIFMHILENAIKYTPSQGSVRVEIGDDNPEKNVRITISDSGVGMTHEQITAVSLRPNINGYNENLEDGQMQTNNDSSTIKIENMTTGIGLYITQEIVNAHNGVIRIQSAGKDQGTTVIVEVPQVTAEE